MDTLTHVVLGAAVGEGLMGKQIGKKAMLWGAVAANAPDIDAMVNFFVSDIDSLVMHRGITHSVFTAFIFGPLMGLLLWKAYKEKGLLLSWMLISNYVLGLKQFTPLAVVVVFNTFLIGIVLMAIGLVALYIGTIHTEVINRPLYLIRERLNFDNSP